MKQYDIWWANLPNPIGRRPVLLLSRTPAYQYLTKVLVAEITTNKRGIPQEVGLDRNEGLPQPCVANMDNIHVVPKRILAEHIGAVGFERQAEVKRAVGFALDWIELKRILSR